MCRQIRNGKATFVIPGDVVLREEVLEMFYDSPVGGYLGLHHMVHWLSHRYHWYGMYHNCRTHIHNYLIC